MQRLGLGCYKHSTAAFAIGLRNVSREAGRCKTSITAWAYGLGSHHGDGGGVVTKM